LELVVGKMTQEKRIRAIVPPQFIHMFIGLFNVDVLTM